MTGSKIGRREFLRTSATAVAGVVLIGCAQPAAETPAEESKDTKPAAAGATQPVRMQSAPGASLEPGRAVQAAGSKDRFDVIHQHITTISNNQQTLSKGQNALSKNQQTLSKNQQTAFTRITQAQEKVDKLEEQIKKLEQALGEAKGGSDGDSDVKAEFLAALDQCIDQISEEVGDS